MDRRVNRQSDHKDLPISLQNLLLKNSCLNYSVLKVDGHAPVFGEGT